MHCDEGRIRRGDSTVGSGWGVNSRRRIEGFEFVSQSRSVGGNGGSSVRWSERRGVAITGG